MAATHVKLKKTFNVSYRRTSAWVGAVSVSTWIVLHYVSISPRNVSIFSGFLRDATSFRVPHKQKSRGLNLVSVGDTQYCLLVLTIELVEFHQGSFWRLGDSVSVRHLVASKMAHSHIAQCSAEFCGVHANSSSTTREAAELFVVQCPPDHALNHRPQIPHECTQLLITLEIPFQIHADTVFVLCTLFQISSPTPELSCVARKTPVQPPFRLTVLPFDKVALAFMWLEPSFERLSQHTPYVIFGFNFENIHR
jgi:hypothetical protein